MDLPCTDRSDSSMALQDQIESSHQMGYYSFERLCPAVPSFHSTVMSSEVYLPGVLGFRLVSQPGGGIIPRSRLGRALLVHSFTSLLISWLVWCARGELARSGGTLRKTSPCTDKRFKNNNMLCYHQFYSNSWYYPGANKPFAELATHLFLLISFSIQYTKCS